MGSIPFLLVNEGVAEWLMRQTVNLLVNSVVGSIPTVLKVFSKWIKFCAILLISLFLFFDEEPFFDLTDWNILHIFFFISCIIIIIYENIVKSKYGQFVSKDQTLMFSTFSYWFFIQNYFFLIVIFFCFHCLTPLEIELFELVEIYSSLFIWCFSSLAFNLIFISLLLLLAIALNFFISWSNRKFTFITATAIFILLIINIIVMLWDFLFSSLTNTLFWDNAKQYYIQSRSSLTYDNSLFITDQFDWHRGKTSFFIIRFEDLYLFFIQLFSITSLFFVIVIWFFLLNEMLSNFLFNREVSYVFISVCLRWIDNCLFIFFINYLLLMFVGLRVSFKLLVEALDYSFFM